MSADDAAVSAAFIVAEPPLSDMDEGDTVSVTSLSSSISDTALVPLTRRARLACVPRRDDAAELIALITPSPLTAKVMVSSASSAASLDGAMRRVAVPLVCPAAMSNAAGFAAAKPTAFAAPPPVAVIWTFRAAKSVGHLPDAHAAPASSAAVTVMSVAPSPSLTDVLLGVSVTSACSEFPHR